MSSMHKKVRKKIKNVSSDICLVDKFLILFMLTLFIYTAVTLFTGTIISESTKTVDIVVRSSAASIFGYFISSNFIKTETSDEKSDNNNSGSISANSKSIGFSVSENIQNETASENIQGTITQDDIIKGDVVQGDAIQKDIIQGDALQRDTFQDNVIQRGVIQGDALQGETGDLNYGNVYDVNYTNNTEMTAAAHSKCNTPQIIIISMIGLLSLILMFISNKYADAAPHAAATIAQLRDFVSACVGFLVSCGKKH